MTEPRTFLAMPTYGGTEIAAAGQVFWAQSSQFPCMRMTSQSSLLAYGFNSLWAMALNHRNEGITHFAMLHADIVPLDPFWLDTMREMMDRTGVDVISAVVPIKSSHGFTSTALDTDPWHPRKLTLKEVADLPVTFQQTDIPYAIEHDLLINTGCMVVKFTDEWVERFHFHIADSIAKDDNGIYRARVSPEDWNFSRWLNREGIKIAATSAVKLLHVGTAPFSNSGAWGQETDMGPMAPVLAI